LWRVVELVLCRKLGIKELQKRISNWDVGNALMNALSNIKSPQFNKTVKFYRDLAHHRIPPSIEYGLTGLVTRVGYREDTFEYIAIEDGNPVKKTRTSKGIVYAFGGVEPIKAGEILAALKTECENAKKAFYKYWEMIEEHVRVLTPNA